MAKNAEIERRPRVIADAAGENFVDPNISPIPRVKARALKRMAVTPARARIIEKAIEAAEYRAAGYTYRQIAQFCGYNSAQAAYHAVGTIFGAAAADVGEELIDIELQRLDKLYTISAPVAFGGDLNAIMTCLAIIDRRARFLGLYKPDKIASTTPNGSQSAMSWPDIVAAANRPDPGASAGQ